MRKRFLIPVAGVVVALALAGAALSQAHSHAATKLVGTVGPGYTIKLTKGGKKVSSLKAGKYTIAVTDKSSIHNFTLEKETGAKVEKHITGTGFVGSKTLTLTMKAGKWKYYCSVHEPQMFGFVTVK